MAAAHTTTSSLHSILRAQPWFTRRISVEVATNGLGELRLHLRAMRSSSDTLNQPTSRQPVRYRLSERGARTISSQKSSFRHRLHLLLLSTFPPTLNLNS